MKSLLWARVLVVAAGLVALTSLGAIRFNSLSPPAIPVLWPAPLFRLTNQVDQVIGSDQLQGKIVIANFIYTSCTDICPLLSFRMRGLYDRLSEEQLLGSQVILVSFTVDPDRDTPEVLRAYASRYQGDPALWHFLTGASDDIVPLVVEGFRLGRQALPASVIQSLNERGTAVEPQKAYEVMHSGRFMLIDQQWQVRTSYDGSELNLDQIVRDIRQLSR